MLRFRKAEHACTDTRIKELEQLLSASFTLLLFLLLLRAVQVELAGEEGGVAVVYLLKVRALSVLAKLHTSEASLTRIMDLLLILK